MQILGWLVSVGVIPGVAWPLRFVVRDVLEHRWKMAVLRRTPKDQVSAVVTALNAKRRTSDR